MGMVYQRGKTWWIKYYYNGQPIRESAQTELKMVAKTLLQQREGEISQGKLPGIFFEKTTFDDLAEDLLTDYKVNARKSIVQASASIKHLKEFFGGMRVKDISTAKVNEYVAKRMEDEFAPATINRQLAALKRMLNMGARCTPPKVNRVPHFPMLKERNTRKGFFEHQDFIALRDALPAHLKGVVTFGYRTGWRLTEVVTVTWAQVDTKQGIVRLEVGETKNDEGRTVYLDDELKEVFRIARQRRKQLETALPWVFLNEDGTDRVKRFYKAWKTACKNAGIGVRIFHDFRRTAVRNMVRAGIPERVAMQISGHKTRSVFDRYSIVSDADLRQAAQRQQEYLENLPAGTISGTIVNLKSRKPACPRSSGG